MPADSLVELQQGQSKFWMLLIGVNDYRDPTLTNLDFAVADCQSLAIALSTVTQTFPRREIFTHYGSPSRPLNLAEVETSFDCLFDSVTGLQAEDIVLVYFAGHGVLDPVTQELYLCLAETRLNRLSSTAIGVQQLLQRLRASGVGQQIILLDACHSAKVEFSTPGDRFAESTRMAFTQWGHPPHADPDFMPKLSAVLQSSATQSKDFSALLSCSGPDQQSWELAELQHGVFTYYLVKGLQGGAADHRGRIDLDRLYKYVRNQTEYWVRERLGRQQVPNQIKAGCRDLVIGLQVPQATPVNHLSDRSERYRQAVRRALKRQYPLPATIQQKLLAAAEELLLPPATIAQIESEETRSLVLELENYQHRATQLLLRQDPQLPDPLIELRRRIGLPTATLAPLELAAQQQFKRHEATYRQAFANLLQQGGDRATLKPLQQDLGLGDGVVAAIAADETRRFKQQADVAQGVFAKPIHPHPVVEVKAGRRLTQAANVSTVVGSPTVRVKSSPPSVIIASPGGERSQARGSISLPIPPVSLSPFAGWPVQWRHLPRPGWWGIVAGTFVFGSTVAVAIPAYHTWQMTQTDQANRDHIHQLLTQRDFQGCINQATRVTDRSQWHAEIQTFLQQCRELKSRYQLNQVKVLAKQDKSDEALALLGTLELTPATAAQAKQLRPQLAAKLLQKAEQYYQKGKLDQAIELTKKIPKDNSKNNRIYAKAQSKVKSWSDEWPIEQALVKRLNQAKTKGQWAMVIQLGQQIKHPQLKQQVKPQIQAAIAAQQQLAAQQRQAIAAAERRRAAAARSSAANPTAPAQPIAPPDRSAPVWSRSVAPPAPPAAVPPPAASGAAPPDEKRL